MGGLSCLSLQLYDEDKRVLKGWFYTYRLHFFYSLEIFLSWNCEAPDFFLQSVLLSSVKHGEVIPLIGAKKSVYALKFSCLIPPLSASSFIHQCLNGAAHDSPYSLKINSSIFFPTLGSRFLVIISAGSRTLRRSSQRLSSSPAILMTNTSSMWRMKLRSTTSWMPWAIASSLWKVCRWMKAVSLGDNCCWKPHELSAWAKYKMRI